ncbi:MAG: TatD family hydrolase [Synergistaceae bacterium]|nr:TatD family hydrolase [Synergistaceae bacterium]
MLIDSHCHLDSEYFPDGLARMLETASANNVRRMLYVGCNYESSLNAVLRAEEHEEIYSAVGLHPEEISKMPHGITDELKSLAQNNKIVAIGEIGIDYYWDMKNCCLQKKTFAEQIEWAKAVNKPVIVHVRDAKNKADGDAMKDALEILNAHNVEKCGGVIHCFGGNPDEAAQALSLGLYISFSGIITFKNSGDLRKTAEQIPIDRILCETDSPYLAPVPYRGKSNQPAYVAEVYKCLAEIRNISLDKFSSAVEENCKRLFKW